MATEPTGATLIMHRRLAWNETDAAGHNHFSAAFRWMEEAEHALWDALGCSTEFTARIPRVHIEIDYTDRILYNEEVAVIISVTKVGGASCTFSFIVDKANGSRAATGSWTVVHVSGTSEGAEPWPDEIRAALNSPVTFEVSTTRERR